VLLEQGELNIEQRQYVDGYFLSEVLPVLTPLSVRDLDPFPLLPGLGLNLAVRLGDPGDAQAGAEDVRPPRIAVVPIPGNLPRFVTVPAEQSSSMVRIEQVIRWNLGTLFPQDTIEATAEFRLTRDADVTIDDDSAGDLLETVEQAVTERRRRSVVRLEVSASPGPQLRAWLMDWCDVSEEDLYEIDGLLDARALMDLASRPGFDEHRDPPWPPQPPRDFVGSHNLWDALSERDVLLFHPYESFDPVVRLVEMAAEDTDILAVKQTLYRTSGDSPIIAALARAAEAGKQVTVLVELKARFDEARNVNWARRLEDAGCHVIYGVAGLKTHAKVLLIVRREPHGIRRYVHLSTGNYNDRTAKLYSDIGLMTTDRDFGADAAAFFNLLTGYSQDVGWTKFAISPTGLRRRFEDLIDREIQASSLDQPGLIMAKVNSLEDPGIARALYRASRAGVKVLLNVRGICCLRPGVKHVSDNIRVVSIVDRYLEHARIYYFRNGGHPEVYLSSADWMRRNLDRRLEVLFPVQQIALRDRVIGFFDTFFADNVKAWELHPEGRWSRLRPSGNPVRAQAVFYREAVEAAQLEDESRGTFQPLTRPEGG
jgi:polyphosphate kinase